MSALATLFKYIKLMFSINTIIRKLCYAINYCKCPYRIIVFGASGTGKTQLIALLKGDKLKDHETTYDTHKYTIHLKDNGRRIVLYDAPGHKSMKGLRKDLKDAIIRDKIKGVINVVSYGYAERSGTDLNSVFQKNTSTVKEEYLNNSRTYEISQLKEWVDAISKDNRINWIITLINKADIWSSQEQQVFQYYWDDQGVYGKVLSHATEHCKHFVLKYCCRIEPFYDRQMLLYKGEKYAEELRKRFINELIRLITGSDDAAGD